jgi:hypothetical protein
MEPSISTEWGRVGTQSVAHSYNAVNGLLREGAVFACQCVRLLGSETLPAPL